MRFLTSSALPTITAAALLLAMLAVGPAAAQLTDEQRAELERLATLGYLSGEDPAPATSGLMLQDPDAWDGYTVYLSGDFAGAFLVDINGRILHTWSEDEAEYWVRVHVYPDGGVLAATSYPGRLIRTTADSDVLWTFGDRDLRAHHDLRVLDDGTIYAVMRTPNVAEWYGGRLISEDQVCVLRPEEDGVLEVDRFSVADAFLDSEFAGLLEEPGFVGTDPFHTNSVEVLDGRVPHSAFCGGNLLLSIRNMDCLAVLDTTKREIVWVNRGRWQRQHEARVTPEGRVMLFDNRSAEGRSRVVEYDVADDHITWSYSPEGFFSRGAGAQQLLPNGNILVTESQKGRIIEITRGGRVVWEYLNPRRLEDGDVIARVQRAFRIDSDYFTDEFAETLRRRSREQ